jgi:cytochrome c oxidase accessory protein FixG
MCPWPRIQSAMMDEKSLTVTYKDWRGEPRGSLKKAEKDPEHFGDCIDCLQCVSVCPTGIDIREGPQIGCITCALCIDACDRVMAEIGRPRGLIDYVTLEDAKREAAGEPVQPVWKVLLRPRTVTYLLVWSAVGLLLLFALGTRRHIDISVAPDRNPPFMLMSDGSVRDAYTVKLRNMQSRPRTMRVAMDGLAGAAMWTDDMPRADAARQVTRTVPADATLPLRIYVIAPAGTVPQDFALTVTALDEEAETDTSEARFEAPESEQ